MIAYKYKFINNDAVSFTTTTLGRWWTTHPPSNPANNFLACETLRDSLVEFNIVISHFAGMRID